MAYGAETWSVTRETDEIINQNDYRMLRRSEEMWSEGCFESAKKVNTESLGMSKEGRRII